MQVGGDTGGRDTGGRGRRRARTGVRRQKSLLGRLLFGIKVEKEVGRLKIFRIKCHGSYHILVEN